MRMVVLEQHLLVLPLLIVQILLLLYHQIMVHFQTLLQIIHFMVGILLQMALAQVIFLVQILQ